MSKPIAALGLIMTLLFVYQSLRFKASESSKSPLPTPAERDERAGPSSSSGQVEALKAGIEQRPAREKQVQETKGEDEAIPSSPAPTQVMPAVTADPHPPTDLDDKTGEKKMTFDIKAFAVDELFVLPQADRERFLEKNQLKEPGKADLYRYLSDPQAIDSILKGTYQGQFESIDGKSWTISLKIDGQIEEEQFKGEFSFKLLNAQGVEVMRSTTEGPLDEHIRVVEQGDKHSLRISPNEESPNASVYQIFIGSEQRSMLAGNYYQKKEDQSYELLGPFVLKRTGSDSNN